ncbi:MAG: DUF4388 domain-containing protein [Actinomycetota bacterium]
MLNGNLDSFALPDVLRFVASGGVTGRIEIAREEVEGELALDQGNYVGARLNEDEAPSTVDEALDVAVLLFDGTGGTFNVVEEEWVGGPLSLSAEELVKAVERRRKEWAAVVDVLGSLEEPLIIASDLPKGVDQITIRADQWRLLSFVDGRRSVQEIAHDAASSVYATAVALAEMANAGMIARGEAASWAEPPSTAKAAAEEEDAAEALHDLAESEEESEETSEPTPRRASSVRPLRAPTREEQRIRLRR